MADNNNHILEQEAIRKLRKGREHSVQVGKFTFKYRRPTQMEMESLLEKMPFNFDFVLTFVTGWEGVTYNDIVGGGETDEPATFSPILWKEWLADRGEFWNPIYKAITDTYNDWIKSKGDLAKN